MDFEELEQIKKEIKNYKAEIIILIHFIITEEIKRRMEKKKNDWTNIK